MSGIITMVDSELGGVLREYRQVEYWDAEKFLTTKLEPTDVVVVDGERYRMVDRKAKVGEKVLDKKDWDVAKVVAAYYEEIEVDEYGYYSHDFYVVLEPLPTEECTGEPVTLSAHDIRWNPEKVIDMFAALAQKVTELERQNEALEAFRQQEHVRVRNLINELADANERAIKRVADRVEENGKNIVTLAQEHETLRNGVGHIEDNTDDIAMLDERTQPANSIDIDKLMAIVNLFGGVSR